MAFQKAENLQAFLKVGLLGFMGSGKTHTTVLLMTAFHKFCKSKKPIFFCDTETGSDWAVPIFKKAVITFFPEDEYLALINEACEPGRKEWDKMNMKKFQEKNNDNRKIYRSIW